MYVSYLLYQTQHTKTAQQQREEDIRAGELAAGIERLWHSLPRPRNRGHRGFRSAPEIEMLSQEHAACSGQCAA